MEDFLKNLYSIIILKKDYLIEKRHGSFFRTRDLKKSCDIDFNQISKKENLNSFLIELANNLIKKQKEYPNLIIINIELDTITDERIEKILKYMNTFNFKLEHILNFNEKDYPEFKKEILDENENNQKLNLLDSLPKEIVSNIEKLINNYNINHKNNNKLYELFKLHSYLKEIQKLRVSPQEIINDNLILNGKKISLKDKIISKITVNIIFENKPVSNVIYYKSHHQTDFYFKFSKLYSSIDNNNIEQIYYYHLLKELKYYIIVGYFKKIFPKHIAYLLPKFKEQILEFKETLNTYSYKLCKYDTLIITDPENKEKYKKKYLKYYNRINNNSKEFIDSIKSNPKLYKYLLENIEIRF
jgi:hypothetical protein